ncbi:MAG TPA: hypothetical protein VFG62_09635 [Rhodopila sp.]|jgi:hypothetical protein|nr:hypothetical protein [Rhodopila sp.]
MEVSIEDRFALYDLLVRYTTSLDTCDIEAVVGAWRLKSRLVRMDIIFPADRWAS